MKERKIYWRRKGKKIVAEGRHKGKTIYLFTLPEPDELLRLILDIHNQSFQKSKIASFLTKENLQKNIEIIKRLEIRQDNEQKQEQKVPTIKIIRSPFQDAESEKKEEKKEEKLSKEEIQEIYSGVEDLFK